MNCVRDGCGHENHVDGKYECMTCSCPAFVYPVPRGQEPLLRSA